MENQLYHVIHSCERCIRVDDGPFQLPPMPPIPAERVATLFSFASAGLDFLRPLFIKIQGQASNH